MANSSSQRYTRYENAVVDNLAYDMSRQTPEPQRYSTAPELERPQQPKRRTRPAARAAQAPVMAVAPAAVVLFAVMILIWVFTIQTASQISMAQREIYRLESALGEVEKTHDELLIAYETAYNFADLEDYAVGELGMQLPREEQSVYFSSTASDQAVAVAERLKPDSLMDRFADFLTNFKSYLP